MGPLHELSLRLANLHTGTAGRGFRRHWLCTVCALPDAPGRTRSKIRFARRDRADHFLVVPEDRNGGKNIRGPVGLRAGHHRLDHPRRGPPRAYVFFFFAGTTHMIFSKPLSGWRWGRAASRPFTVFSAITMYATSAARSFARKKISRAAFSFQWQALPCFTSA